MYRGNSRLQVYLVFQDLQGQDHPEIVVSFYTCIVTCNLRTMFSYLFDVYGTLILYV